MPYKVYHEPNYERESIRILENILNGQSIKNKMDDIAERRGHRYDSVFMEFFKAPIALEKHIKKNIRYNLPGFEKTGREMAEFLFKKRGEDGWFFAMAILGYNRFLQYGIDNKGFAILSTIDENFEEEKTDEKTPQPIDATEFFALLEKYPLQPQDALDAIRLYHQFDMYLGYAAALFSQTERLIKDMLPAFEITTTMDYVAECIEKDSAGFLRDNFNVTLDDTHLCCAFYPGLYETNSLSAWGTDYTDVTVIIGLHVFDMAKILAHMESSDEKAELFLKALSDSTKLGILKLLKDSPMYGSQLAEKLNCTAANISHHTSALLTLGIVRMEKENNRVYFHLNRETISQCLDDAKGLFL